MQCQSRSSLLFTMTRISATARLKIVLLLIALSCSVRLLRAERVFEVVEENTDVQRLVGQIHQSGGKNYMFSSDSPCGENFTINATDSTIHTKVGLLDREVVYRESRTDEITCFVTFINTTRSTTDREPITIRILDINDETPRFSSLSQPHFLSIVENIAVPAPVVTLQPSDLDNGPNGTVTFSITGGNSGSYFNIGRVEGDVSNSTKRILYLIKQLDFESIQMRFFNLTITISDMGTPLALTFEQRVNIAVSNSQDEAPTFPTSRYEFAVAETQTPGPEHTFGNVTADNADEVFGTIFYTLINNGNTADQIFGVNQLTGGLYLKITLDYEDPAIITMFPVQFYVEAYNPSINGREQAFVTVNITDVNEIAPNVTCSSRQPSEIPCPPGGSNRLEYSLVENSDQQLPLTLAFFTIQSGDLGQSVSSVTVESTPEIDLYELKVFSNIGVYINQALNREETPNITITITAYDPPLTGSATIFIRVLDENDNTPQFPSGPYHTQISDGTPVGKVVTTITALDEDEGENGRVTYSISNVDKTAAHDWFEISDTTGEITVTSSDIDYNVVNGRVTLTVTATDNGAESLSNSTIVVVDISPVVTFTPASYQEYKNFSFDVNSADFAPLYVEFRTTQRNGLLLYQPGSNNDSFGIRLDNGIVRCWFESGGDLCVPEGEPVKVETNQWHSVSLQRMSDQSGNLLLLSVWVTDFQEASRTSRLLGTSLADCNNRPSNGLPSSLFIGGVDPFSVSHLSNLTSLTTTDFVGLVHNVLLGSTKIDLGCPAREENTIRGSHDSDSCETQSLSCESSHTTGCVGHDPEPYCRCLGGFPHQSCIDDTNSYAPIRFRGNTRADLTLDYSFFYDLELQRSQVDGGTEDNTNVADNVGTGAGKRRRQTEDLEPEETIQNVNISFRPVEVDSGVLLSSRTKSAVHLLKFMEAAGSTTHTIVYMVSDLSGNQDTIYIPVNINLQNNSLYQISVKFTTKKVTLAIQLGLQQLTNADNWGEHAVTPFAEQPSTFMSIGGTEEEHLGFFVGCISSVTINNIDLPLNGLLTTTSEFMTVTNSNEDEEGGVESSCNLCDLTTCSGNMECIPSDLVGDTNCVCPTGSVFDVLENKCTAEPPTLNTGPLSVAQNGVSIYVIIGGACGGVVVVGIVIVLLIVCVRVAHVKRDKRKRTYSVHSLNIAEMRNGHLRSSGNQYEYTPQPRRDEPALTSLAGSCATSKRGSSVSTYQEHCEDADPEIDTPRHYSRRKSTTSVESGIKTDTDRDPSIRDIPRMDDSGNERDTDYSPPESESDDLTSSCCMETALSPVGVQLVGSSNSVVMGVPSPIQVTSPRTPLTPQERKIITPLRPPSTNLSMSELDDIHRNREVETDAETEFSYQIQVVQSPTRNGRPVVLSRPVRTNSDSDKTSTRSSTPKWYKSSTASDTEREKERVQNTRSYYATHTSPTHNYPPLNPAPEYRPPPSFSEHKSSSPLYPNSRGNRMMHTMDSPLARNTHKYENHPLPYSTDLPVRDRRHEYDLGPHNDPRMQQQYMNRPQAPLSNVRPPPNQQMRYTTQTYAPAARRQNSSDAHSRHYNHHPMMGALPTNHYRAGAPSRSFSTGDAPPSDSEQHFQDLKSVSTINPISYWEMQDRMKAAVDQVDPYHILSEPYVQFEDVSTSPSVTESQITLEEPLGPEHQVFESQGGGEGTADVLNPMDVRSSITRLQDNDLDSVMTESDIGQGIKHFPSADCSDEYTATLVASSSGDSTPKMQPRNGFVMPLSQQSFDV